MKTRDRLLSGLLALALCAGLISPALAEIAEGSAPTENGIVNNVPDEQPGGETPEQTETPEQPETPAETLPEQPEEPEQPGAPELPGEPEQPELPDNSDEDLTEQPETPPEEEPAEEDEAEEEQDAEPHEGENPVLTYGQGAADEALRKGESGRVYLDNMENYAIAGATYTTNNPNIIVDQAGNVTVRAGYAPKDGETFTVTANVSYYDPKDVVFFDSFEGDKQFTSNSSSYTHSAVNPLFGRYAATATGTHNYPARTFDNTTDVTVTAWYYDENVGSKAEDQLKFGFGINGGGTAMGIFFDSTIAAIVEGNTYDHYGMRVSGTTYNDYAWGGSNVERSQGWHKFEWVISSTDGMTMKIDGKVVSTHQGTVGKGTPVPELTPVQNIESIKSLTELRIMNGWSNNGTNLGNIANHHFIDGVTVVKTGAATQTLTLTSAPIPVLDTQYTTTPETIEVENSAYPKDAWLQVEPNLDELNAIKLDGTTLSAAQWHVTTKEDAPQNAAYYPVGELVVYADAFKNLSQGNHKLTLVMISGSEHDITVNVASNKVHTPASYYLSNSGSDSNNGRSASSPWATFDKLSTVTFGPGDHIYLDATSVWSSVQFRPIGSGAEGSPVVISSYNNGGDPSKRPILNGDGTVANRDAHSYLAFEAWREFYPSGTIELFNVEYWEIYDLEITNYASTYTQAGVGRNGIAVIHDYFETQGIEELPGTAAAREQAYYRAGKLQHIYIENCYIHDVTGVHPGSGGHGRGGKMSGGINIYGPYDGLKLDNNIVMYCDVEGIRNDVLVWTGDTRTQLPCYMEDISISNNFIAGVTGDGVVISSAVEPRLAYNYLTDAGYSYFAPAGGRLTTDGGNAINSTFPADLALKPMGNRENPILIDKATNFAGLWFIGTMDAVAEYNESVNNVWVCNDAEAFDADMFTWGTVFQYNYTYRNNGGFCLFMSGLQMDDGTVVRYNVSVEDGIGLGMTNDGQRAVFHYNKEPDAIYNNLFILGDGVKGFFGGSSHTAYFYNNIVIKPDGNVEGFNLNNVNNSNASAAAMNSKTIMNNNLFYPAAILDNVTGDFTRENNITPASLDGIFVDLEGFLAAQPVNALVGRSAFTGSGNNAPNGGPGVAMSIADGRAVTTPNGTGFDYAQFAGIKTAAGSPTIGAGVPVELTIWPQTNSVHPLTQDFFKNNIANITTPDIGPYQSNAARTDYTVTFNATGGTAHTTAMSTGTNGKLTTLPTATRVGYTFNGWFTAETGGTKITTDTVFTANTTVYAQWSVESTTPDPGPSNPGGTITGGGSTGGSTTTPTVTVPVSGDQATVQVSASVSGNTATVSKIDTKQIENVIGDDVRSGLVEIDFSGLGTTIDTVNLPADAVREIAAAAQAPDNDVSGLSIKLSGGEIAFNADALAAIQSQAGTQITLTVAPAKSSDLNARQREAVGSAPVFDLTVKSGGKTITSFGSGYATVSLPYALQPGQNPAGIVVYYLDNNGNIQACETMYDVRTQTVIFTTGHLSLYFVGYDEQAAAAAWENPFQDVRESDWFYDAVRFVSENGLMNGYSGGALFGPNDNLSRAQLAQILYNKEGRPAVAAGSVFTDVPAGEWYADAVNWAAANGIVTGYGDGRFGPNDNITREQLAVMLWRYAGKPAAATRELSFSDNDKISSFAFDALYWAVENGVMSGYSGKLDPTGFANRGQVAQMLMNYLNQ